MSLQVTVNVPYKYSGREGYGNKFRITGVLRICARNLALSPFPTFTILLIA